MVRGLLVLGRYAGAHARLAGRRGFSRRAKALATKGPVDKISSNAHGLAESIACKCDDHFSDVRLMQKQQFADTFFPAKLKT